MLDFSYRHSPLTNSNTSSLVQHAADEVRHETIEYALVDGLGEDVGNVVQIVDECRFRYPAKESP